MYIKIYFGEKPVFLCDSLDAELNEYMHHEDTVYIDEVSTPAIKSLLHEIAKPAFHAGILYDADLPKLKKAFFKHFEPITAAGGLVLNENGYLLMIFRRGKWDLPKGKVDKGESLEACALREVSEETGLQTLRILHNLPVTYHTYDMFGKHMLKDTHWFLMQAPGDQQLTPQTEEDIETIQWVAPGAVKEKLENTYPSVREIIKYAGFTTA